MTDAVTGTDSVIAVSFEDDDIAYAAPTKLKELDAQGKTDSILGETSKSGYLVRGSSGTELRTGVNVRDDWLDPGDLASVEADGHIGLVGRAEGLIIRGGHSIDRAAIEDALLEHPDVTAAAAVGRPDAHAGEVPVGFATVAPGCKLTGRELKAWAAEQAAREALAGTAVADRVCAALVDGQVEVRVPRSPADVEIGETLSQYAWRWRLV